MVIGLAIIVIGSNDRELLALAAVAADADSSGLVVLDNLGFLRRGLGRLARSSSDAGARLVACAPGGGRRAPVEPVCYFGAEPFRARRLEGRRPPVVDGLVAGRHWRLSIGGTLVPGLGTAARVVALTGLIVIAAACLESAWTQDPCQARLAGRSSSCLALCWDSGLLSCSTGVYIWNLVMPFYRPLGIIMSLIAIGVAVLGWSALETGNSRRGLVSMMIIAVALKLAHWGYYVPEWNYRYSQGPWGRAISQWIPQEVGPLHVPRLGA